MNSKNNTMNIKSYKIKDLLVSEELNLRAMYGKYMYISEGDDYDDIDGNHTDDIIATFSIYDKPNGNEIFTHDFINGFVSIENIG